MIELPSIKFDIFKKLEYYQILKQFDKRIIAQLNLQNRKGFYPTWEIEKKILFWSYLRHKRLNASVAKDNMTEIEMFVSEMEIDNVGGVEKIFENMEKEGFGKKTGSTEDGDKKFGCILTKEALELGELIWFLCYPKKYNLNGSVEYKLVDSWMGKTTLELQYFSLYGFMIMATAFFTIGGLDIVGLGDDFKRFILIFQDNTLKKIIIGITLLPFLSFCVSLVIDLVYKFYVRKWKPKNIYY